MNSSITSSQMWGDTSCSVTWGDSGVTTKDSAQPSWTSEAMRGLTCTAHTTASGASVRPSSAMTPRAQVPQRRKILTLTVLESLPACHRQMSQTGLEQLALQPATALYEARLEAVSAQEDVLKQLAILESGMVLACMLLKHVRCFTAVACRVAQGPGCAFENQL